LPRAGRIEPDGARRELVPEPGELPARVAPGRALRRIDRVLERPPSTEVRDELRVPRGDHPRVVEVVPAVEERAYLIHPPGFDHLQHAFVDSTIELLAGER